LNSSRSRILQKSTLRRSTLGALMVGACIALTLPTTPAIADTLPTALGAKTVSLTRPMEVGNPGNGYTIYEIMIDPVNGTHKCLDASTSSSIAGEPGDPMQLYSCLNNFSSNPNQWWNPIDTDGDYVELSNWEWPGLCLTIGPSAAELQFCSNGTTAQKWNWLHFRSTVGKSGSGVYAAFQSDFDLDSGFQCLAGENNSSHNPGQNGDPLIEANCSNNLPANQLFTYLQGVLGSAPASLPLGQAWHH
jgi:hypothetical protein